MKLVPSDAFAKSILLVLATGLIAGGSALLVMVSSPTEAKVAEKTTQATKASSKLSKAVYHTTLENPAPADSRGAKDVGFQTPVAMLEPDESIPINSELQVAEWEQLQEEFVQAVDGRAPSNETEKEAWIRAQQENDDLFRAKFGWDAFRQQQLKAYMEGLAPAPPQ